MRQRSGKGWSRDCINPLIAYTIFGGAATLQQLKFFFPTTARNHDMQTQLTPQAQPAVRRADTTDDVQQRPSLPPDSLFVNVHIFLLCFPLF
jgi:hypothetical protein